jgi:hypothetical protein
VGKSTSHTKKGPRRQVEGCVHARLVHHQRKGAVAPDAALVAERFGQGLAQCDAHILHRVVVVDVQIARGRDRQVDQGVARQLIEHVVEEAHAGLVGINPCPVEVYLDGNLGLRGFAGDLGAAHPGSPVAAGRL